MRVVDLGPSQLQNVLAEDPDMARQPLFAVTKRMREIGTPPAD